MRRGQRLVAAASIIIAAASVIAYVFYRIHTGTAPLWDKVLAAYGLVFCLFLWFDRAAKSVADARTASRSAEPIRPRPGPGIHPLQTVVLPEQSEPVAAAVDLQRVQPQEDDAFLAFVQAFAEELGALDGVQPARDENGHAKLANPAAWQDTTSLHPFHICADGRVLGVCAVHIDAIAQAAALEVFYIDPEARRRNLGEAALERLTAFLRLAGVPALCADISANNWRGARFVEACGFQMDASAASSGSSRCWVLHL